MSAWFISIARNLIFDHVKSSQYRLEVTTSEIIELPSSTGGPEQEVLDSATHNELLRCVRKLKRDQQECIRLRFLQGLSVAETAEIMDRNEGVVKVLQHRALRRLGQLLPEGLRDDAAALLNDSETQRTTASGSSSSGSPRKSIWTPPPRTCSAAPPIAASLTGSERSSTSPRASEPSSP
jgi:hypothetical protein